ncbi:hypothetical protein BASA81_003965 [Batrachochytrium salamandrivorans]|nr:hypothetical protein BASA81_003965 [Batrachochytrium salamandrivorans]
MTEQAFHGTEEKLEQALFRVRLWVVLNLDDDDNDDNNKDVGKDATPEQQQHLSLCEWYVDQPDANDDANDSHERRRTWKRSETESGLSWKQMSDWMANTKRRFTSRRKAGVHPQTPLEYKLDRMCNQ